MKELQVEHQEGRDLRIHDPGLGFAYNIEASHGIDGFMYGIMTSPIGRRSLDVCQLSKDKLADTIPGLERFRRFGHVASNFVIFRNFYSRDTLDEATAFRYVVEVAADDLAHGVKSHATDILVEGVGGKEEFHQSRLGQIIEFGGLKSVFQRYGVSTDVKSKLRTPPWIENKNGWPKIDNVSYVASEGRIIFPDNELVAAATSLDALYVNDEGQFVFKDRELARVWGKLGLLLSSEHWNDPINRLILLISIEAIKRTIFKRYLNGIDQVDNGRQADPEDYTFFCDSDFDIALEKYALDAHRQDGFMTAAYQLLQTLGHVERMRFQTHKKAVYEEFLSDPEAVEYPSQYVNPHIADFGPLPVFVEVLSEEYCERLGATPGRGRLLTDSGKPIGFLKNFRLRQFDPIVEHLGEAVPLGEVDKTYKSLLDQHKQAVIYAQAMKLLMNEATEATFCEALEENEAQMEAARVNRRPLSQDQLRRVIKGAGERATELAVRRGMWVEV